jgi:hypothetical protein
LRRPPSTQLGAAPTHVEGVDEHAVEHHNQSNGVAIEATTAIPRWYGDSLDLDDAIAALLSAQDRSFAKCEPLTCLLAHQKPMEYGRSGARSAG